MVYVICQKRIYPLSNIVLTRKYFTLIVCYVWEQIDANSPLESVQQKIDFNSDAPDKHAKGRIYSYSVQNLLGERKLER
jgi:hypothetical protein